MKKSTNAPALIPLMVTTVHRGVFFGYGTVTTEKIIVLERCRMCISWSADMNGIMGLASMGPSKTCKIGPAVPRLTLQDVTAVIEVSPEAAAKWNER